MESIGVGHERALDKYNYLREVEIFRDLTGEELKALGQRAPMSHVEAGTIFYSPEEPTEVLFILKQGRVRLYHLSPEGKALTTAILEAGTIFGEMALLGQGLHGSYAEALTPCVLCLMSREDVKTLLLGDPRIAYRIAETLGRRLVEVERRLSDFAFKRVPERLAALLLQLARERRSWLGIPGPSEVMCTHEELADMAGAYRETVTKILNEFRSQGLIELHRGKIIILDPTGLQKLSAGS